MAFNRPPLADIIERIATDIESRLPGADARLRRSNLSVLARVVAGVAHGLYGFIGWAARQVIVDTADTDYLERWASVWGVARKVATAATGAATFTGTTGVTIPAGTVLQRSDGAEFETAVDGVIAAGTAAIAITARLPGDDGNTAAGSSLALAAQILGVGAVATVSTAAAGGAEIEDDDSLRARLLARIQQPPQGGAERDYEAWALEVPGVTRAWVKPLWLGAGTVGVIFVRDDDASIIPDAGEVSAVQAYIDERRPVTADVTVLAPTPVPIDITLSVTPDTPAVRAAVAAELADVLLREAAPGAVLYRSHLDEAVSLADGEVDHAITVPAADVAFDPAEMPTLGTITWA